MKRSAEALRAVLEARAAGATLRQAAAVAGVHVSTVCRWAVRLPDMRAALNAAERAGWRARTRGWRPRPRGLPTHPDCPACGARAVVRTGGWGGLRFWRCDRWPRCRWASWRPRYPEDCPVCEGVRYWSHSRRSSACARCGRRWAAQKCEFVHTNFAGRDAKSASEAWP